MLQRHMSETIIYSRTCRTSIFLFWLTAKFKITDKCLMIKTPNTIFGFLPVGYRLESISYRNISSVQTSTKVHIFRLLIGMYFFFGSFRLIVSQSPIFSKIGIVEIILGFLLLLHCYKKTLKIINNSSQSTNIEVPFFEGNKINAISREINNQVVSYF